MIRKSFASFRHTISPTSTSLLSAFCAFLIFVACLQHVWISREDENTGNRISSSIAPFPKHGKLQLQTKPVIPKPSSNSSHVRKKCEPPPLEAFNKEVLKYYDKAFVDCGKVYNRNSSFTGVAFTVKNGNHLHRLVDIGMPCCFMSFFRDGDRYVGHLETCHPIKDNVTIIPKHMEFIKVLCKQNKTLKYRDAFPMAHDNLKTTNATLQKSAGIRLNVAIIGLDSTSRLNFLRQMPLSSSYLLDKMGAISLEGYSIVGQGTIKNLLPMLTGISFAEFFYTCAQKPVLDECPFIWKEFAKRGYLTNFADDWAIFNEYWPNAFNNSPTDYYFRPYLLHMAKFHPALTPMHYCFGPRLAFEVILNFMQQVREKAEKVKRPYFQFTHTGRLAHDYMNHLGLGDVPLLQHLQQLKESGALNNTVLMVLGDHGFIQGYYFFKQNGKLEYRLPVAYIVLPPWFENRFPKKYRNLRGNIRKMTTPYDIHETLKEMMKLGNKNENRKLNSEVHHRHHHRGLSLFKPIPDSRKCIEAGISLKWCRLCHPTIDLNISKTIVEVAAKFIAKSVNDLTKNHRDLCAEQSLGHVKKAYKWDSRDVTNELCNAHGEIDVGEDESDYSTRHLNVSCTGSEKVEIINLQLAMVPYGNIYQGEVLIIKKKSRKNRRRRIIKKMLLTDNLLRIDMYENSGHCVPKTLKPYCMCKQSKKSKKLFN